METLSIAAATCTEMVVYQPVIVGIMVYNVACVAYTVYRWGQVGVYLTGVAVNTGVNSSKAIYRALHGSQQHGDTSPGNSPDSNPI